MSTDPYLSVVLPAYNEARAIGGTLASMREFFDDQGYTYEVIVAADGDDETPEIVKEIGREWSSLRLTFQRGRHGKGHGLRRGMSSAQGEIIGFIDADNKTPITEMPKLLAWFEQGYDLVVGSRGLPDSRVEVAQPWYRRYGSRGFGLALHTVVGLNDIVDTQCGFKFFQRPAARAIFERTRIDGYMCDVEILCLARQLNLKIKQVGILWRDDGDSRLELVRGNARNFLDLLKIRFHRYPTLGTAHQFRARAVNAPPAEGSG